MASATSAGTSVHQIAAIVVGVGFLAIAAFVGWRHFCGAENTSSETSTGIEMTGSAEKKLESEA